ncbi:MAG: PKD domain-containing protein [Bacteroidales bacterium]|nr:PKD domain-containing protein [Bacteroidales bacterium]
MIYRLLYITLFILAGSVPFRLFAQPDAVTGILATDCGNGGNAGDICVSFNKPVNEDTIAEYRIMVLPEAMVSTFTLEIANLMLHYTVVMPSDSNVSVRLEEQAPDVNGNPVTEEKKYYIFVLSVAADTLTGQNALSEPSNLIILSSHNYLYAGRTDTPIMHYVDPEPDISMVAEWDSSQEFYLDLNGDGADDYRLSCLFSGAIASYTRSASITGTAPGNRIISSRPSGNFLVNKLNVGDPLTYNDSLVAGECFLSHYVYYDGLPDFQEGYWTGAEDKYAGLVMFNGNDTLVGWIKMSVPSFSSIVIKEYAWTVYSHNTKAAFTYEKNDYEVRFTSLAEGESSVYWDFGDGTFSWERDPLHIYTMEKDYLVMHSAFSLSGSFMASQVINICEMPTSDFTYELSKWGQLTLHDQSHMATKYRWDFGDGIVSTETSPEHYYQEDGTYTVSLLVTRGECADSASTVVEVCIFPKAEFYYQVNGIEINFYSTSIRADSLSWDFRDGSGSSLANPVHTFNITGEYYVLLHAYNGCGKDSVTHMVYVGLEEMDKDVPVSIYPVPVSDKLYILPTSACKEMKATLYNAYGNIMLSLQKDNGAEGMILLDLTSMAEGVFFLQLTLDDRVYTRKIVVMR